MKQNHLLVESTTTCSVNKKTLKTQKSSSLITQCIIIFYFIYLFNNFCFARVITPSSTSKQKNLTEDKVCNIGDEHECICSRSKGNFDNTHLSCDSFYEKQLTVILIKLLNVNLDAVLSTNETYQQYFRRRVANILSKYCEHQANECPGTTAALRQQRRKQKNSSNSAEYVENDGKSKNVERITRPPILLEEDDEEPTFTRENIVILRVSYEPRNRTNVFFVVTKTKNVGSLSNAILLDPVKVKYIMSAQIAPLSRVLGGIRIEQLRIARITKPRPPYSNKNLLIIVGVCAGSVTFCCLIAAVRVCWDSCGSQDSRKDSVNEKTKPTKNYGTCTNKFLSNYDAPNGKPKSRNANSETTSRSKKRKSRTDNTKAPHTTDDIKEEEFFDDTKQRRMKNMFKCDPSQLPREICMEPQYEVDDEKTDENCTSLSKPFPSNSEDEDAFYPSTNDSISPQQPLQGTPNKEPKISTASVPLLPSVVLVSSQNEISLSETNNNEKTITEFHAVENTLGTPQQFNPYERPLSRRGSRESTPEQGVEGGGSSREDTPLPIGDEFANLAKTKNKNKRQLENSWTSESEEEDEDQEIEVYHPLKMMSDDEEQQLANHHNSNNNNIGNVEIVVNNYNSTAKPYASYSAGSSDSEDCQHEEAKEQKMLDRYQYERLQESPLPPPIMITHSESSKKPSIDVD